MELKKFPSIIWKVSFFEIIGISFIKFILASIEIIMFDS